MKIAITEIEKIAFKKKLLHKCIELIERRIADAVTVMQNAQAAANAEEKSSAGDKYETSRAMSHLEKDMHAGQLTANRNELAALFNIDCTALHESAAAGSFIQCEHCSFFIAAGLGKINFEGRDIYFLSPNAPLAKSLFKKRPPEVIEFNKKLMTIQAVY